jgi:hypothetical protein
MDTTIRITIFAVLSSLVMICSSSIAANAGAKQNSYGTVLMARFEEEPYEPAVAAGLDCVDKLTGKGDIKGLLAYANSVEKKYAKATDKTTEYMLLQFVESALEGNGSSEENTPFRKLQVDNLALYLLRQKDIPIDIAVGAAQGILENLIREQPLQKMFSVEKRKEYMQMAIKVLWRFNQAILPTFDPKADYALMNGVGHTSLGQVELPYVTSIAEFARMNYIPYNQAILYKFREDYKASLADDLADVYSIEPRNTPELVRCMNHYHMDGAFQANVLAQINAHNSGIPYSTPSYHEGS